MHAGTIFSIVESSSHPNFSPLYQRLGLTEIRLDSQRKAISELKKIQPDYVVADFIYAFATYYQATNISNLDVLLNSLVKYAPQARVIVLAGKDDLDRVDKLNDILPLHAVLSYPVSESAMESALTD